MTNKDSNSKQAMWVAMGSLASFGFSIVSSMILSRYFDKADYGTYRQVMYVYNTLLFVFTLGLTQAFSYFLPRVEKEEGLDLVWKITRIFFIGGACFSVLLFFGSGLIASILENPDLSSAIKVFAIAPFLMLPTMGLESIYATYRKTHVSTIYVILTRILMLLCVALPVLIFRLTYIGALWGFVIASFVSFIIALYLIRKPFSGLESKKTKISYKDIFGFSLPLVYASFWGIILKSSDQFFISRYFGASTFADFSNGFIELPFVGMIVGACSTVLFPLFSKCCHESDNPVSAIYPVWISVFNKTVKLIYPLIIFSLFYAKDIMIILYGGKYADAALYFQIMQVSTFFHLIAFAPLVLSLGKTKFYSNVHMVCAIAIVLLEYISIKTLNSPFAIAWISSIIQICKILALLYIIARVFGISVIKLFPVKTIAMISMICVLILIPIKYLINIENSLLSFVIAFIVYGSVYLTISKIAKIDYWAIIKPFISK